MREEEKKAVEILMSPCKIHIVVSVADDDGASSSEIREHMNEQLPTMAGHMDDHLRELIKAKILATHDGRYLLTHQGKKVYEQIQHIAEKIPA